MSKKSFDAVPAYKSGTRVVKLDSNFSIELFVENDQRNEDLGKPARVIYHWTAGSYKQVWDGYHYCIAFDAATKNAYAVRCLGKDEKGKHLWGRNTSSVGISLCAMASGAPVTQQQLELAAQLGAEYCAWNQIDPRKKETVPEKTCDKSASNMRNTGSTIQMPVITDHATYAKEDNYGAWRQDIGNYLAVVNKRLLQIYDELKAGKRSFELLDIIK